MVLATDRQSWRGCVSRLRLRTRRNTKWLRLGLHRRVGRTAELVLRGLLGWVCRAWRVWHLLLAGHAEAEHLEERQRVKLVLQCDVDRAVEHTGFHGRLDDGDALELRAVHDLVAHDELAHLARILDRPVALREGTHVDRSEVQKVLALLERDGGLARHERVHGHDIVVVARDVLRVDLRVHVLRIGAPHRNDLPDDVLHAAREVTEELREERLQRDGYRTEADLRLRDKRVLPIAGGDALRFDALDDLWVGALLDRGRNLGPVLHDPLEDGWLVLGHRADRSDRLGARHLRDRAGSHLVEAGVADGKILRPGGVADHHLKLRLRLDLRIEKVTDREEHGAIHLLGLPGARTESGGTNLERRLRVPMTARTVDELATDEVGPEVLVPVFHPVHERVVRHRRIAAGHAADALVPLRPLGGDLPDRPLVGNDDPLAPMRARVGEDRPRIADFPVEGPLGALASLVLAHRAVVLVRDFVVISLGDRAPRGGVEDRPLRGHHPGPP